MNQHKPMNTLEDTFDCDEHCIDCGRDFRRQAGL